MTARGTSAVGMLVGSSTGAATDIVAFDVSCPASLLIALDDYVDAVVAISSGRSTVTVLIP